MGEETVWKKQLFTHLATGHQFRDLVAQFLVSWISISSAGLPHDSFSCAHRSRLFTNCQIVCCWISPVGVNHPPFCQHTKEIYIPRFTPPHILVVNHDNVNEFFLFNSPQHGQRENGRGRGRENPQGPWGKGELARPASACVVLVHTAPRTSLPDEHPLPRGKTRGEATPARGGINKGGTMAAATAAGSKAAAAGSEAGCRPRNFECFGSGHGYQMDVRLLSGMDGSTFCGFRTWDWAGLLVCLLLLGALASVGYLVHDSCFSFAAAPAAASFLSSIFAQWESEYHDWTHDWRGQTGKQDVVDLLPRTNDEPHGLLHCIHAE